jgi:hypothetical protein
VRKGVGRERPRRRLGFALPSHKNVNYAETKSGVRRRRWLPNAIGLPSAGTMWLRIAPLANDQLESGQTVTRLLT